MSTYSRSLFVLVVVLLGLSAISVLAVQTDNHGIHAVPTPGKVTIDGALKDWDLSGQILQCYDIEALQDIYSARIAMMYDTDNLYVSIHWKDPIPMGNSHDPHYQAGRGWAGDCVQLRFRTDTIRHVNAWYYAPKNEPFLNIDYGKSLTEPFDGGYKEYFRTEGWKLSDGAEEAFLKDADGKGYVQEIKLPWKLITTGKQYKAGDQFACGIELLWGEADWPVHRYADNLAEGASSREFFWTAYNAWGPVFLEAKGNLKLPEPAYLKSMVQTATPGPVKISYNLPYDARVTLAINDATGKRVRNLIPAQQRKKGKNTERWDGLDDAGTPVPPGRYNYTAIYHNGIHTNWIMSFANPGNPTWDTKDGKGAYYGDHASPSATAAAGNYVALACPYGEAGTNLIGCDLDGKRLWGQHSRMMGGRMSLATDGTYLWITSSIVNTVYRVKIATGEYAPWQKIVKDAEGRDSAVLDLPVTEKAGPSSLAVRNGILAICLPEENTIKLLDGNTGEVTKSLTIPSPRSAAFFPDGSLIVLSNGTLLRVTADGASTPFTAQPVADGYAVITDGQGNVYLSVRGKAQNVQVFTPQGQPLREIGQRGGRPYQGAFIDQAMLNPAQLAIDSKDRLWVAEEANNPKRTSIWSTDGTLAFDLIGTTSYAGAGAINPYDPTMAFSDNCVYKINLATGSSRPVYSLGKLNDPDAIFWPSVGSRCRVVKHGDTYYVYGSWRSGQSFCTMYKDGQWRIAAVVGIVARSIDPELPTDYTHPVFAGHTGDAYAWADRNGDGLVQADEMQFAKGITLQAGYWGTYPDEEGTIPYLDFGKQAIIKLPITGFTACGAPIYDVAHPQVLIVDRNILAGGEGMLLGGSDGRVYVNQTPLIVVDKTGHVLFTYPSDHVSVHGSHTATASRPGYLIGPSSILGTADLGGKIGELFYLNGNLGENYIFTADGLYVQSLFKDVRGGYEFPLQAVRDMPFDMTTAGGESFGGNFSRTPDGKCYVVLGGTDARVIQVNGLDSIKRLQGTFSYTAGDYATAQRLAQENAAKAAEPKVYTIAKATAPVTIDGKADEWSELLDDSKKVIEIQDNPQQRFARVQARYDAQNLYLGYRVLAGRDRMRNVGQDMNLLFKSGDSVDLMFGPAKSKNGEGNLRLLFAQTNGNDIVMLYQPVAPDAPKSEHMTFANWHKVDFDRVVQVKDVKFAVGGINGGYFVEAQIPWSSLGVRPTSGLKLRGDLGVLFADNGGTTTVSRQYWSNKATGLVNDIPGEAELTPNLWGELTLE